MEKKAIWIIGGLGTLIIGLLFVGVVLAEKSDTKKALQDYADTTSLQPEQVPIVEPEISVETKPVATHISTPTTVRALYMSAWVASTPSIRQKIIDLADSSEINAVVIDIKDATGRVSFLVDDPTVSDTGSPKDLIKNISELIQTLHDKNIYVIGRISVFQDPYLTQKKPEWALKTKSTGAIWKDRKGLSFLDPTKEDVWDYVTALAQESYAKGFDEINFDYIRFPSDGNIKDIAYPTSIASKADAIRLFWEHIHQVMTLESHIPTSADVFGLTTEATDDMGIGQVLENALPNFDFVAPMIYPSHYPKRYQGFANPATKPYEVVTIAMKKGVARAAALGMDASKFRPWIQDFNMGATYTAGMIKDQIRALHEQGIDSYMVWDPANTYTTEAYNKE
jgi:hypothetical protein